MFDLEDQLRHDLKACAETLDVSDDVPLGLTGLIRRRRRTRFARAGCVALALVAISATGWTLVRDSNRGSGSVTAPAVVSTTTATSAGVTAASNEQPPTSVQDQPSRPLVGSVAASCVEGYSLETLKHRAFAFDGTVVAIGQPVGEGRPFIPEGLYVKVLFDVHEWFRIDGPTQISVDMIRPGLIAEDTTDYDIGSRLLITGEPRFGGSPLDSPVAWECGFSRTYDAATASEWRAAFDDRKG